MDGEAEMNGEKAVGWGGGEGFLTPPPSYRGHFHKSSSSLAIRKEREERSNGGCKQLMRRDFFLPRCSWIAIKMRGWGGKGGGGSGGGGGGRVETSFLPLILILLSHGGGSILHPFSPLRRFNISPPPPPPPSSDCPAILLFFSPPPSK